MSRSISVVMLDDDAFTMSNLAKLLSLYDIEVVAQTTAVEETMVQISLHNPDVVFVDVMMPIIDGPIAVALIRQRYPEARIVAMTTVNTHESLKAMIDAGAIGYIMKSADPEEVRTLLVRAKAGDHVYSQGAVALLEQALPETKPPANRLFDELSATQQRAVCMVIKGYSNEQIANELHLGLSAVKQHVRKSCEKYRVTTRVQLAVKAIREGVDPFTQ